MNAVTLIAASYLVNHNQVIV